MASVNELRQKLVSYAQSYLGAKQGDAKHKKIIDIFNSIKPYPDGWAMTYSAAWCAAFVTACAHACGFDSIIPESANCGVMMTKAMKMGIWVEDDNYSPRPGDLIMYDWQDSGAGDDRGAPDHVGIVAANDGKVIRVIEGNFSTKHTCDYRVMSVGGRYIRGYIVPMYAKLATAEKPSTKPTPKPSETAISKTYRVISKRGMNVRALPQVGATIVGVIAFNSTFKASKRSGNWVYSPSMKGWVCAKDSTNTYLVEVTTQPYRKTFKVVTKLGSNIRSGPGTNFRKIGGLTSGKTFVATKQSGNWVYGPSLNGWVCVRSGNSVYLKEI